MDGRPAQSPGTAIERRPDWKLRVGVRLAIPLARLLALTWRVREVGRDGWRARQAAGEPSIICLWHGQMLTLFAHHRNLGVAVLISEHRDGEIIARVLAAFGYKTIRGSTSRGGGRALLELVATLRSGHEVSVTPDGPRGPRHEFAPGALIASQRSAAPIIGVVAHVDRVWRLKSWDGFEIPKPFARITAAYSAPLFVDATTPRDAAAQTAQYAGVMRELAEQARQARDG